MDEDYLESTTALDEFGNEIDNDVNEIKSDNEIKDEQADDEASTDIAAVTKIEKKRKTLGPRHPLLDANILCGSRGLLELRNIFDQVKFRGKGHEFDDLNTMMAKLEYWAHKLCPKLPFEEVLTKIEDLGSKRAVQIALHKIRMGELMDEEDAITAAVVDDLENDNRGGDNEETAFDNANTFQYHPREFFQVEPEVVTLTDDQRLRIEENKRRALERLAKKSVNTPITVNDDHDDFDKILLNLEPGFDDVQQKQQTALDRFGFSANEKSIDHSEDMDLQDYDEDAWMAD